MVWKIGQLAAETGLTVRALHHYDHLGLVCPSARTHAGHRLYADEDVERLYRVLALRQLGLPLDAIGAALDGSVPIRDVLAGHRAHLDERLVAIRTLRAQLTTMIATAPTASVTDLLDVIRKVTTVDDTVKKYFDEGQLADLAERRAALGEEAIADVAAQWAELIPRVQAAVEAGTDPTSAQARDLARQWMGLLHQFHGGDEGLRDSLYRMAADNTEVIEQNHGGPSPAQLDFIRRASEAVD